VFTARYAKSSASAAVDVAEFLNPNPLHTFQTTVAMMEVKDCEGNAVQGADVTYFISNSGGGNVGTTGPSGVVSTELFPGTYSFTARINKTSAATNVDITAGDPIDYTFVPTVVDFHYTQGRVSMWQDNIGTTVFNGPTYIFPGNYTIDFYKDSTTNTKLYSETMAISGCSYERAFAMLTVRDENGNGVSGGAATPACGGSWQPSVVGVTDTNGKLWAELPPCYTKIKMTVNQGAEEQTLVQLDTSNYTWTTEILRIWLNDHAGTPFTDGNATLDQGGGYWYNWGNLNNSGYMDIPLFARASAYKFRVGYNYTSQELYPVVSTTPGIDNFYFQAGQVFGPCITQYSTGAWRTFTTGMELMPGSYTFKNPSQTGVITAGGATYLTGCSGVYGSGTLDAYYSSPTVTINAYEGTPDSGSFNIIYGDIQGTFGEAGTTISGNIVCLNIDGANANLGGLVTQTNSPGTWQVGQYVRFAVSADMLNFTAGEAAMPNCTSDGITPNLHLAGGGYSLVQ
jgi:hypothetical protein